MICPYCDGSGEGMSDGTSCRFCLGTGEEGEADRRRRRREELAERRYDEMKDEALIDQQRDG